MGRSDSSIDGAPTPADVGPLAPLLSLHPLPTFDMARGQRRLQRLLRAVGDGAGLIILVHNDPDPDALASAWALQTLLSRYLGITPSIVYGGIIGRAENRAFVSNLKMQLTHVDKVNWEQVAAGVLIDTQISATNYGGPTSFGTSENTVRRPHLPIVAVFDHHEVRRGFRRTAFHDVRPAYGATSTILTEYLAAAEIRPDSPLATALFYGIKTDTRGLARDASDCDAWAYMALLPLMDPKLLAKIEQARLPRNYFKTFNDTLARTVLYDRVVLASLGIMERPDMAAEMADIMTRLEGADWVVCWGRYQNQIVVAVRTQLPDANAAQTVREVVGDMGGTGGHAHMAGGRIPHDNDPERVEEELRKRFLRQLNVATVPAQPLIT